MDLKPLFVFPRWSNTVTLLVLLFMAVFPLYAIAFIGYALDPATLNVGYQPVQPVPYSHALHVGQLGLDCRYCHNTVEKADFAAIPPTETCMNCHRTVWTKKESLEPIRESFATGLPVKKEGTTPGWRQVTTVPDYVYFNHSAHVNSGVSCVECHGQVNQMDVVYQAKPMNMAWCLQCHRDPVSRLRPRDQVTKLDWQPTGQDASTVAIMGQLADSELLKRAKEAGTKMFDKDGKALSLEEQARTNRAGFLAAYIDSRGTKDMRTELGTILKDQYHINPNTDCITCHR